MSNPAESAAHKLAWEMGTWKSIEVRFKSGGENKEPARKPDQPRTFQETCHYIETAAGQRLFDSRLFTDLDNETAVHIDYKDGSKCATLVRYDKDGGTGQEQVTIQRAFGQEGIGFNHRPEPLRFLYVGLKPLPEVLPQAQYLGEGRRLDRKCDRFL